MKVLLITEQACDLSDVLESCNAEVRRITPKEALNLDFASYDSFCILSFGTFHDARLIARLEAEADRGKRVFAESIAYFKDIYSSTTPNDTTRKRLIYVDPQDGDGIPGLTTGDLLDEHANQLMQPYFLPRGIKPILVYKEHILAHTHLNATAEEIMQGSIVGLWLMGEGNIMMTSFLLHNFNRARFAPRNPWEQVIRYIAKWITGSDPAYMPAPILRHGPDADLSDPATFEKCRKEAIERGIGWLKTLLVDNGLGGMGEGPCHSIHPEGDQDYRKPIRNDCTGESAGAFKMYAHLKGDTELREICENLDSFTYGPMLIKGGLFDGMMRWSNEGWPVCYQDDVARTVLGGLYDCLFLGHDEVFPSICKALDFLVKTTAKDGCRVARTETYSMTPDSFANLTAAEVGCRSAHYNAYYHAALLLAYKHGGNPAYLDTARKGLETLMSVYPDTRREQSETEEMCRLVLPLAILYDVTKDETHKAMLYRVVNDLQPHKHPSGGYREWDTGYKASCSRESTGECSVLTENGDPIADLLYSVNWLPMGFAYAYYATRDEWFKQLWHEIIGFFISCQVISENPALNGSWCRAFDMDLREAYACPHDVGWAACCSESGWTDAEILMGMMFMDIID